MSALDDSIRWLSDQVSGITNSVESWSDEWQSKVNTLKVKAEEFSRVYNDLLSKKGIAANDPRVQKDYDNLMKKGEWLQSSVGYITGKIDGVYKSFISSPINPSNEMGLVPLVAVVPVVAITGSIAAISAWLLDAYALNRKLSHIESQVARGTDPKEARAGVESTYSKGSLINVDGTPAMGALVLLGVGVAAYFLWPKVIGKLK